MGATAVRTKTAKHSLPDPWGLGGISHAPVQAKLRPVCRTGKEGCHTYKTTCQPRFHPKFSPYREISSSNVYPPRHFQTDEKPQDNLLKIHNSEKKPSDKDWVKNEGENADQCLPLRLTRVYSSRAWRGCCHPTIAVLEELVSQHGPQTPTPLLNPTRCQHPVSGCCPKPRQAAATAPQSYSLRRENQISPSSQRQTKAKKA